MLRLGPLVATQPLPLGRSGFMTRTSGKAGLTVEGVAGSEIGEVLTCLCTCSVGRRPM